MQSNFSIISDLGNFRFSVQCLKCGHDFYHRSGQENYCVIDDGKISPLCPICLAKDDVAVADEIMPVKTNADALGAFGITLGVNDAHNEEPWEVYDDTGRRRSMSRRLDECVAEGKRWIEQDISGSHYDGNLTAQQIASIKFLFPVKGPELLAFCRAR